MDLDIPAGLVTSPYLSRSSARKVERWRRPARAYMVAKKIVIIFKTPWDFGSVIVSTRVAVLPTSEPVRELDLGHTRR